MAEVAKGIIDIEINTGSAAAQLKALQQQINAFNLAINKGNTFQTDAANKYSSELKNLVNSSRFFTAETVKMKTSAAALDATLRKGQGTLGQFFNAKFNRNSALFAETMGLAAERARTMQTQFVATSGASRNMQEALAIRPLAAFNSQLAIASQRSQILTNMFKQGTTQLINFGKNVQWAGRQLMVGFTLPLTAFGTVAGRTFMELEKQAISFKKVYGDIFTTPAELQSNLDAVMSLGKEYTKYGIAVKDTVGLAAQAAAAGRRNKDLTDAVAQSTRLATLGQIDQNTALETTIALQSAFKLSGKELADSINFLNMVENQTVVSLQDLSLAIPKVAPVIVGLGGNVQDLAVFLAAMQEGGVSAGEGANALKSGLASLINPTSAAKDMLAGFGINLEAIVNTNKGNLRGTVTDFAMALQTLDEFSRQQALEQVFGKFQFARLGALFENIVRDGSQAQQVMDATKYSTQDLARTADKELSIIENSFGVQLTGAIERLKLSLAPIGQLFVQMAIPIINFITKIVDGFNNLPDFTKKFIAFATIITGLVIPAGTMFFGLLMNLSGTLAKLLQSVGLFGKGALKGGILGGIQAVSQSMKYMSLEEIDASIAAKQLGAATMTANDAFRQQVLAAEGAKVAVMDLAGGYQYLINRMAEAAGLSKLTLGAPGAAMGMAKSRGIKGPKRFATGGVVPGTGNKDTVPAMLTPGEFVVNKDGVKSVGTSYLKQLNNNKVGGYQGGDMVSRMLGMSSAKKIITKVNMPPKQTGDKAFTHLRRTSSEKNNPYGYENIKGASGRQKSHITLGKEHRFAEDTKLVTSFGQEVKLPKGYIATALGNKVIDLGSFVRNGKTKSINQMLKSKNSNINPKSSDILNDIEVGGDALFTTLNGQVKAWNKLNPQNQISNTEFEVAKRKITSNVKTRLLMLGKEYPINDAKLADVYGKAFDDAMNTPALKAFDKTISEPKNYRTLAENIQKNATEKGISIKKPGKDINKSIGALAKELYPMHEFAKGGSVPSLLTPGEFVVGKDAAAANRPFLDALNAGNVKKFEFGTPAGEYSTEVGPSKQQFKQQMRIGAVSSGASRIGGAAGVAAFPAMIAGPALQASSNELAQKMGSLISSITPVLFGMQLLGPAVKMIATRMPFLMGPWGVAVAATVALGVGLYKFVQSVKSLDQSGVKLRDAMYGSEEQLKRFGEAMGRQTLRQQAISDAAQRAGGQTSDQAKQYSTQFLSSEGGKKLLEDIKLAESRGEDTVVALRNQLSRAMTAGLLSADEAKAIAADVGIALNKESLAVDVAASITNLYDKDGKLIPGNLLKLNAEINPVVDTATAQANAEEAYNNSNFAIKALGGMFEGYKNARIESAKLNEITRGLETGLAGTADSVVALRTAFDNGDISQKDFEENLSKLRTSAEALTNQTFKNLGVSITDLDNKTKSLNKKPLIKFNEKDLKNYGYGLTKVEKAAIQAFINIKKQASGLLENAIGKDSADSLINTITDSLAGGDAQKSAMIFADLVSGSLSEGMIDALLKVTYDPKTRAYLNELKAKAAAVVQPGSENLNKDFSGGTGEKSKIQELIDSTKETNNYSKAIQYLVKSGIKPEALANLDAATAIELMNGKRKDLIKLINNQATMQRVISNQMKSSQERQIDLINMEIDAIDASIDAENRKMDAVNRANELDQRRLNVRQHGLDLLSQKEATVNKVYDDRVNALNRVRDANNALAQQQQDRINLASALTTGDIAGAAQAASTMGANFASGQIANAQTELEAQRQREIESLTVSINGQLMTRKQIEDSINVINEQIYQRNLSSLTTQDAIYRYEEQKKIKQDEINTINRLILAEQVKQEAKLASQRGYLKDMVGYYKDIAYWINQAANKKYAPLNTGGEIVKKAFGGMIKKYAFGGMAYGSKESPPPLKMALGSMVPGLGNTDRVPALLTPGEFVVKKSAAAANMPLLNAINSDVFPSISASDVSVDPSQISSNSVVNNTPVYTYNVSVNVPSTDATPDQIANIVAQKMRKMSAGNMRGNRY